MISWYIMSECVRNVYIKNCPWRGLPSQTTPRWEVWWITDCIMIMTPRPESQGSCMHLGLRKTNTEALKVDLIRKLNQNQIKAEKENKPSYFMRDIKHASGCPSLYLPIYPSGNSFPKLQALHMKSHRNKTSTLPLRCPSWHVPSKPS